METGKGYEAEAGDRETVNRTDDLAMQKLDLHVVSIPDRKAEMEIAQTIVSANHLISLHTALEMVRLPPILLYHNITLKDAEKHINRLKSLGVGFKVSKVNVTTAPEANAAAATDLAMREFANIKIHNAQISPEEKAKTQPIPNPGQTLSAEMIRSVLSVQADGSQQPEQAQTAVPAHPIETLPQTPRDPVNGAAGLHHGGNIHHGARGGGGGLDKMAEAEDAARRKNLKIALGSVLLFTLIGLVLYFIPKDKNIAVSKPITFAKSASPSAAQAARGNTAGSHGNAAGDTPRAQVTGEQRRQANAYVDSAKASGNMVNAIAFYRMAISFNRYNLAAWQGLLQAYRDAERHQEARETEEQMREIFGNEIMSINSLVKRFGEISDAYMNDNGTYRIEYKTRKRTRNDITREVFNMTRAARSVCNCNDISIFATTGTGRGLIAHSAPGASVHSLSSFLRQTEIVWLD